MGLDGLIEAKFSSTVAAPHRVPGSSAHCSIKGSFGRRASSTCTYAEHTLMGDETRLFQPQEGEEREGAKKIRIMKNKNSVSSQQRISIFKRTAIDEVIYY